MNNRIIYINERLADMRIRYKAGSPAMKAWILQGAKLLKDEKASLEKRAEKEESLINQDILPLDNAKKV